MAQTVAALYVEKGGVYWDLPDVDPWDEERDARKYAGPWPVVAHPPCERWGRYWSGGPSAKVKRIKGDDGGCFAAAITAVRIWGGVLEHPEASHAWAAFGLTRPPKTGGWVRADDRGWTCCVEQGHYGHRARKATWLYLSGAREAVVGLRWGPAAGKIRLDDGMHHRHLGIERKHERISAKEASATPLAFRDLLLAIARASSTTACQLT